MPRSQWITTFFLIAAGLALTRAASAEHQTLSIPRVDQPPEIEQFLNGTRPPAAVITELFQREPGDGVPVSQKTEVFLSYDSQNLYVVFVCHDQPGQVRAHMTKREAIFGDDIVGLVLDTFNDHRRGYEFLVNPLGVQLDGIFTEGKDDDYSFDTLWHSEGRLTPFGYIVKVAIPFKSLRFPNQEAQRWGFVVARQIPRENEMSMWPYVTKRLGSFGDQMATLEGLSGVSPGRNMQFIPYGTFTTARVLGQSGPDYFTDQSARGGLDAKMVLRDALTLDIAANPDFSQVESDEPQVTINQRFEVFFPEKRPFFIENAGFFETNQTLFFSRRIADPQIGARLTGKTGRWAFAGLAIDDRAPGHQVPASADAYQRRSFIGVARLQREFGSQSNVGVFVSSRDFASSANRVVSLDTRLALNPNWFITGQMMRSVTTSLDGEGVAGPAYYAKLWHSGRHFYYRTEYIDRSPGFRSDLGFIPRVDTRQVINRAEYTWRPKAGAFLSYGPSVYTLVNHDHAGRLQDWEVTPSFDVELKRGSGLSAEHTQSFEHFEGFDFRQHETSARMWTAWFAWLEPSVRYTWGTRVNYYPAEGLTPFLGDYQSASLGATLRPSPRLRFEQTYLFTRLRTRDGVTGSPARHGEVFNNHIYRAKVNYQFTRALSVRAIVDYQAVLPNDALVALSRTKQLRGDLLLTYLVNPWTALYVGYTDAYENLDLVGDPTERWVRTGGPTTSTGRQFFVKMSYLLRY